MDIDEGARKWLAKTCKANHWRVSRWIDLEDLLQDGYLWYYATIARYGYRPRTRAHIMSLFKRTFMNYLHDLANYRSRLIDVETAFSLITADENGNERTLEVTDDGVAASEVLLQADWHTAPEPVQRLLTFATSDDGAKVLRESPYHFCTCGCGGRETTDQRIGRLIGCSGSFDYRKALTKFLGGEPQSQNVAATIFCDELDYAMRTVGGQGM